MAPGSLPFFIEPHQMHVIITVCVPGPAGEKGDRGRGPLGDLSVSRGRVGGQPFHTRFQSIQHCSVRGSTERGPEAHEDRGLFGLFVCLFFSPLNLFSSITLHRHGAADITENRPNIFLTLNVSLAVLHDVTCTHFRRRSLCFSTRKRLFVLC